MWWGGGNGGREEGGGRKRWRERGGGTYFEEVGVVGLPEVDVGVGGVFGLDGFVSEGVGRGKEGKGRGGRGGRGACHCELRCKRLEKSMWMWFLVSL